MSLWLRFEDARGWCLDIDSLDERSELWISDISDSSLLWNAASVKEKYKRAHLFLVLYNDGSYWRCLSDCTWKWCFEFYSPLLKIEWIQNVKESVCSKCWYQRGFFTLTSVVLSAKLYVHECTSLTTSYSGQICKRKLTCHGQMLLIFSVKSWCLWQSNMQRCLQSLKPSNKRQSIKFSSCNLKRELGACQSSDQIWWSVWNRIMTHCLGIFKSQSSQEKPRKEC